MDIILLIKGKKTPQKGRLQKSVRFVLIDAEKQDLYPSNFVCILPSLRKLLVEGSNYANIMGENGVTFAQDILSEELRPQKDREIMQQLSRV